jgi:glutamate racemase
MVKSPEQLEDANITDAVNTAVGLRLRELKRQITNEIMEVVQPQVDSARLRGKEVDIEGVLVSALKHARDVTRG